MHIKTQMYLVSIVIISSIYYLVSSNGSSSMSPDQILCRYQHDVVPNECQETAVQPQPPPQINVMSIKATELDQNNPKKSDN